MEQWCTASQLFQHVPEFKDDFEIGATPSEAVLDAIQEATSQVKHILQSRYNLADFIGLPLNITLGTAPFLPEDIQRFTAVVAATIMFERFQRGTDTSTLQNYLFALVATWKVRVVQGSLLDDSGVTLANTNGPSVSAYDPKGPAVFGDIYGAGGDSDRYGVPNSAVRSNFSETNGVVERV